jgi:hypothetical protein
MYKLFNISTQNRVITEMSIYGPYIGLHESQGESTGVCPDWAHPCRFAYANLTGHVPEHYNSIVQPFSRCRVIVHQEKSIVGDAPRESNTTTATTINALFGVGYVQASHGVHY